MAGPGICILLLADTCASYVHPVFNPVAPYGYLLPSVYLFMADIDIQTCLCVFVGPGFVSAFMRSSASHPAVPHDRLAQKNSKSGPHCWGREGLPQFAQ